MPPPSSLGPLHLRRTGPSPIAVIAVWTVIAFAVIAMTTLGIAMKSGKADLLERTIWDIGWMGWAPLTYLVLGLCRRYPIERHRLPWTISRLALCGVAIVSLEILIDFVCINALNLALRDTPITWKYLVYITVYKAHIYYGVYWMIVGAAHAMEFHRRYRESELLSSRLETKLATAELDRLKAQLQPHFLFNTHNTIVALMLKNENAAAIRMLTRLSDLLRLSLARSGHQVVTMREELETLNMYLEIQRERFRDRLTVVVDAAREIDDAEIPHLLLQPVVENALLHGLEDVTENAELRVSIRRDGTVLICEVRDNGEGFSCETSADESAGIGGIGIANTRERLQQLYGNEQSLSILSSPGHGCTVTIRLPLRLRAATQNALSR